MPFQRPVRPASTCTTAPGTRCASGSTPAELQSASLHDAGCFRESHHAAWVARGSRNRTRKVMRRRVDRLMARTVANDLGAREALHGIGACEPAFPYQGSTAPATAAAKEI